jgi:hypothetical protein
MIEDVSLGALRPGVRPRGILPSQIVTLASVFAISDGVAEVSYRDEDLAARSRKHRSRPGDVSDTLDYVEETG